MLLVIGVCTGIVVGYNTQYATEIAIAGMLLLVGQGIICVVERKSEAKGFALSFGTILLACGIVLGIIRVQLAHEKSAYVCETSCTFEAKIITTSESRDTYQLVSVHPLESGDGVFDVQLRVPLYPRYEIGETVKVSGKVAIPKIIVPHANGKNAGKSFDYGAYLATKNIGSEMMFPKIEVVDTEAHSVREYLGRWKENLILRENRFVSTPASTLATGMLFGNSGMSKELTQTFRVAGLSHIVVLSGFNIALVIAAILFVFAFLPLIIRISLASFFVILFVMMVGAEASILRATAMAFVGLLATLVGRAYVARQALLLSLLVIILYSPNSLFADVSLHLSFLATAGIVYLSEPLKTILGKYIRQTSLLELAVTTLSAYFATLPYVMYTFGTVSLYALIANMLALPLVPIAMLLSFIVVCLSYISNTIALIVGYADTLLLNCILFVAHVIERFPFSYITLSISFVGMCVLYLGTIAAFSYVLYKKDDETFTTNESGYLTGTIKY
jgi:competence protein ComEC